MKLMRKGEVPFKLYAFCSLFTIFIFGLGVIYISDNFVVNKNFNNLKPYLEETLRESKSQRYISEPNIVTLKEKVLNELNKDTKIRNISEHEVTIDGTTMPGSMQKMFIEVKYKDKEILVTED